MLSRRKNGFAGDGGDVDRNEDDDGKLCLDDLLPDTAQQQSYLSWLRKFQAEQTRLAGDVNSTALEGQQQHQPSRVRDPEFTHVCKVIYNAVIRSPSGGDVDADAGFRADDVSTERRVAEENLLATSAAGGAHGGRGISSSQSGSNPKFDDPIGYELGLHSPAVLSLRGAPTRWEDSSIPALIKMSSLMSSVPEDAKKLQSIGDAGLQVDEERSQVLSSDPLGIRPATFDLRNLETGRRKVLFDDGAVLSSSGANYKMSREGSVLPTDSNFSPLLFLSLVHPNASFDELTDALARLEKVADNHAMRLQQLVRDNFPLFVRCAEGIDWFSENIGCAKGGGDGQPSVGAAIPKLECLEALIQRIERHADDAFRPLLDNTTEVRRTKNALAILSRVGPILSVPNLMANHLEAGRVAEAVKAYRRVKLINDSCGVELLKSVREKAMEAASEARESLVKLLASSEASTNQLLGAVRDMKDLDELDGDELFEDGGRSSLFSPQGKGSERGSRVRNPALLCLEAQADHFAAYALKTVRGCDELLLQSVSSETSGPSISYNKNVEKGGEVPLQETLEYFDEDQGRSEEIFEKKFIGSFASLKISLYATRVACCQRASSLVMKWLPRLMRVSSIAHDIESQLQSSGRGKETDRTVTSVLEVQIADSISVLTDLVGRCSIGNDAFEAEKAAMVKDRNMTGERIKALESKRVECRVKGATAALGKVTYYTSPLPPGYNSKCANSLSNLSETIAACAVTARRFKGYDHFGFSHRSKNGRLDIAKATELEICAEFAVRFVVACEKRWCSNALDHCATICATVASSRGFLDVIAVTECVQKLGDELHRGFECGPEIEAGVLNCIETICENLSDVSKGSTVANNLKIVGECSKALQCEIDELVDVVGGLGSSISGGGALELREKCIACVQKLEKEIWGCYIDKLKGTFRDSLRTSLQVPGVGEDFDKSFPPKLANALMCIVRNRALVEDTLPPTLMIQSITGKSYVKLVMEAACSSLLVAATDIRLPERGEESWERAASQKAMQLSFLIDMLEKFVTPGEVESSRRTLKELHVKGVEQMIQEFREKGEFFTFCFDRI